MRLHPEDIKAISQQVIDGLLAASKERKAKKPRRAKAEAYTPEFEQCWKAYPKRPGNNKREAFSCFSRRLEDGIAIEHLYKKTLEYAAHCDSSEKTGTDYVLMGRTFYGCNHKYDDDWPVAVKKKQDEPWAKIPYENNDLEAFCIKHKYKMAGAGKTYPEWRRAIQREIDTKLRE
jgi:hypothetical protein